MTRLDLTDDEWEALIRAMRGRMAPWPLMRSLRLKKLIDEYDTVTDLGKRVLGVRS